MNPHTRLYANLIPQWQCQKCTQWVSVPTIPVVTPHSTRHLCMWCYEAPRA